MIGLRSQFGEELVLVAAIVTVAVAVGIVIARRRHLGGQSWKQAFFRVLAIGAVAATIVATAYPRGFGAGGDLVLELGRGGLGDWRVVFRDTLSLQSIELVANILLYAAAAFTLTLGWPGHRRLVVPACVSLSLLIEVTQWLALDRVAAVDDLLLNSTGAVIGFVLASALERALNSGEGTSR